MPSAKSEERIKAEAMYRESQGSMKLVDIAARLGISPSKVRKWKSLDGWDKATDPPTGETKKKQVERSTSSKGNAPPKNAPKKKRGAQPGHPPQGGAKPGNLNAATHGAYINFYRTVLTDEEAELLPVLAIQKERDRLQTLYAQHQITERRLMEEILAIRNGADTIAHKTTSQIEPSGQKNAAGKEITKVVKISQEQVSRKDQLRVFTEALTRVRAEMRRTADSLRQLEEAEAKNLINESTQSLVEAMTEAYERRGGDSDDD